MMNIRPAKLNVVEKKIIESLQRVDDNYLHIGKKKSKWTRAIKNSIGDLGKSLGYEVYASGCKFENSGEWLFDLIWCKEQGDFTVKLPLVLESEWQAKDILWDFTKLVISRAHHRVIIFQGHSLETTDATINTFIEQIRRFDYSETGDRYLFCYWTKNPDKFMYKLGRKGGRG